LTALQAQRDLGELVSGQRVRIHGASGGVGVHAVQIARVLGAHVTTLTSAAAVDRIARAVRWAFLSYDAPAGLTGVSGA